MKTSSRTLYYEDNVCNAISQRWPACEVISSKRLCAEPLGVGVSDCSQVCDSALRNEVPFAFPNTVLRDLALGDPGGRACC